MKWLPVFLFLALSAASSHAQRTNYIYFQNDTEETISTAVGYRKPSGQWIFTGYWTLGPGEYEYVANPTHREVFVWAVGLDYGTVWKGGYNYRVPRDGKTRPFRKWNTGGSWGTYTYSFHY